MPYQSLTGRPMTRGLQDAIDSCADPEVVARALDAGAAALAVIDEENPLPAIYRALAVELRLSWRSRRG